MFYRLGLLVSDRSSVSRAISVKSDYLGSLGPLLVNFNFVLGQSGMNDLVSGAG
jgi:hypothetical protein